MEKQENGGVTYTFIILTIAIVSYKYTYIKTLDFIFFVQLDVYRFYLNKAVKRRKKKTPETISHSLDLHNSKKSSTNVRCCQG